MLETTTINATTTTSSPQVPLITITTRHLELCQKLCRQIAKAWSDQLRQDPHQPMAVVAEWIDQVADYGRFWEEDHAAVLQDMLRDAAATTTTSSNNRLSNTATTTTSASSTIANHAATLETTTTETATAEEPATSVPLHTNSRYSRKHSSESAFHEARLPMSKLLRLGKLPVPTSTGAPQVDDDDADDNVHTNHEEEVEEEDHVQRATRLLQSLQEEFRSGNTFCWPYGNVDMLQQVADEIPQRLHFDKLPHGENDPDSDDEGEIEAIPKSVWEQRQRQHDATVEGEHVDALNDSDDDDDNNNDKRHADPDEQSSIISRWVEKSKRSHRQQAQRSNDESLEQRLPEPTTVDTLAIRPNKRCKRDEDQVPRVAYRLGRESWTMEQIKASLTLEQYEKLMADMVHSPQEEIDTLPTSDPPLLLLGALKTVGHVHCALQHVHDMTTSTLQTPAMDMDSWSSKQCKRWFRKVVQERLGSHRYIGKDEHGFSYQKYTKVLRTVDPTTDQYWLDLDLGECLLEVPRRGTSSGRRTLCAFSSLEVTLLDEDEKEENNKDKFI
jgi:hypothetical protein